MALCGLIVLSPVMVIVWILGYKETGAPVFVQERVGRLQRPFNLYKFRTMHPSTASVATHMVDANAVTPLGQFLRKTKIDELPQLVNVLKGEMSLVGPRPCLFNQQELIDEREQRGVNQVLPGITGLAQINGVDMSQPRQLAELDKEMITTFNLKAYFGYILQTAIGRGAGDRIKHHNNK
ncbi:lipid carrier : UDP-N-acetylgalactosaminyltransferase [Photobacterium aquae]|uniref:Lipid carrier: UDP-N-acetylgalactosaminyltransferase n=2 Tax=Photobacterium aquae TaxID=1195763 RepID=A0A0J1JU37_9GAMM|nr:lipid carrier : UDP-N-acetylgalactosaminyltransferase [Photobacterium aquae]